MLPLRTLETLRIFLRAWGRTLAAPASARALWPCVSGLLVLGLVAALVLCHAATGIARLQDRAGRASGPSAAHQWTGARGTSLAILDEWREPVHSAAGLRLRPLLAMERPLPHRDSAAARLLHAAAQTTSKVTLCPLPSRAPPSSRSV